MDGKVDEWPRPQTQFTSGSLWQIATADKIVTLMLDHMTNSSNVSHVPVKAGKGLSCLLSLHPPSPPR